MIIESGITIGSGINFTGAVSPIVTSGLQFNLDVAPSSGTTWTDSSGNGRNATLQGNTSYTSTNSGGITLNNASFNGTGYISVPYNISSNTVTVEIVASFNPTSHWATIWGNESYSAGRGYLAFMTNNSSITYGKSTAPTTESITASNSVRHWTFVINGTQHSLYLNGTQVGTTDTLAVQTLFVTSEFYFGSRHTNAGTGATDKMNNSNSAFYPVFYQMRVYNKALSGSEITQNYNAIRGTYGI
jgi:large repetitive protein